MAAFGDQSAKAAQHLAEAEKALKKWTMPIVGRSSDKYEIAAEAYGKAANCYKVSRMDKEAGEAYLKAAEMHMQSDSKHETTTCYVEAGKSFKKIDPVAAIKAYHNGIAMYNESGRFGQSAKLLKEVAEIFEADGNTEGAIESYRQAADLFSGDNSKQAANTCLNRIAVLRSSDEVKPDLLGAAEIFEQLGRSCMEERLLHMNAKGYWLQALLCLLAAGDSVAVSQKLNEFRNVDYSFDGSREFKLVEKLNEAVEANDAETFSSAAYEYDRISKLDPWKTSVLLRCKRTIEGFAGGAAGDGEVDLT